MPFSDTLRLLLSEKNMKAADLARATGLSEAAISDYLNGKKEPRGRQSIAIAEALGVSLDRLWETGLEEQSAEFKSFLKYYVPLSTEQKKVALAQMQWLKERGDNQ